MASTIDAVKGSYVLELMENGTREDGRSLLDFREITIEKGVIPNAEGSARVKLGNTTVLVGIKADIDSPMKDKPDEGNLMVSAELLPLASKNYEPGPPGEDAIELARVVDRGIRAQNMIDLKSLFIEKDKVWSIFIDVYVLNYDGNLFDASYIAAVAALNNTKIPKYEDEKLNRSETTQLKLNGIVTSCTFAKLAGKVVLDPTGNEESVMSARVTISNDENSIRSMQKGLSGSFTQNELEELISVSFEKSKELRDKIGN